MNYYICAGSEHLFGFLLKCKNIYIILGQAQHNGIYCIILVHTEQKLRAFKFLDINAWVHYTSARIEYLKSVKDSTGEITVKPKGAVTCISEKRLLHTTDEWVRLGDIILSRKHKQQILNGNELCDMHVNALQNVVKSIFSHVGGLQSTLLQYKYAITTNKPGNPLLQIIHIRNCHWATLYVGGDDIRLYDSAYTSLSEDTITVIAQLIRYSGKAFNIKIMNVAKQTGSVDCALYSIAMLVYLSLGTDPTELAYNHTELRPHLAMCLESVTVTPFPTLKHRKPANKVSKVEECSV